MKKKLIGILAACTLGTVLLAGCGGKTTSATAGKDAAAKSEAAAAEETGSQKETAENGTENEAGQVELTAEKSENAEAMQKQFDGDEFHHIEIEIANYGTIKLELDATQAPVTVENFMTLAKDGFYDGLTFHRIIDGFMIQGGDPNGNGTGGSGKNIKGEFAANGVENKIPHKEGVISMARATQPDSASCQFFIMVEDYQSLDGQYAAFGWVTEGQNIVDQIAKDAKPTDNNGSIRREEQPVITKITVID